MEERDRQRRPEPGAGLDRAGGVGEPGVAGQDEADRPGPGAPADHLPRGADGQVGVAADGVDAPLGQRRPEAVAGLRTVLGELAQPPGPPKPGA